MSTLPIYTTYYLNDLVRKIKTQPKFFLNRYFKRQVNHEREEIYFDVVERSVGITPYVHPLHQGKVLENRGYKTNAYKPAYVKERVVHDPERPLTRLPGEGFGGLMSAQRRAKIHIANDVRELKERLDNRLEVMALEVCKTGKVHIKGEGFDHLLDFGRDKSLSYIPIRSIGM